MEIIGAVLKGLKLGDPATYANLTVFPMFSERNGNGNRGYLTLEEALANGLARVREVSEGGSVPELLFQNLAELPVLIVDGEELVGAKQNRTANLTILAPAGKTIVIPVSCVEAGRWRYTSGDFKVSERAHFSRGRAARAATVSRSMRNEGSRRSDQGRVWEDISCACQQLAAPSPTQAMAAIFDRHRTSIEDHVHAFRAIDRQVGALFAVGARISGFDLFDCPATLHAMLAKLVRSYAVEAIGLPRPATRRPGRRRASTFVNTAAACEVETYPAVGLGTDIRLTGPGVIAGGLVHDDRLIHLAAFATEHEVLAIARRGDRGMASARVRRDHQRRG